MSGSQWWPLGAKYVCVAQSPRARIHAARIQVELAGDPPVRRPATILRTLCGVDARPVAHTIIGRPDEAVIAEWPPPAIDRCPECAGLTGTRGRMPHGSHSFTNLSEVARG